MSNKTNDSEQHEMSRRDFFRCASVTATVFLISPVEGTNAYLEDTETVREKGKEEFRDGANSDAGNDIGAIRKESKTNFGNETDAFEGSKWLNQKKEIILSSDQLKIVWDKRADGWHIKGIKSGNIILDNPRGYYTILFGATREGFTFYPSTVIKPDDKSIVFKHSLKFADIEAVWKIDPDYPTDIKVQITLVQKEDGDISIETPTLFAFDKDNLKWGMIPGNWYGTQLETNLYLSEKYSQGIPAVPTLATEQSSMSMCPLVTNEEGVTLAVIPDPDMINDPWKFDKTTRGQNKVGMSLINNHNELAPVAYTPIIVGATPIIVGADSYRSSYRKTGDTISFRFRYSIQNSGWFDVFNHGVNDIYKLPHLLEIQKNSISLSERVSRLQVFLRDGKASGWKTWEIGDYQVGANGTKIADAGTMWMLAWAGDDPILKSRLPYVKNYKLAQQQTETGFFKGAALGEYATTLGVTSERGNYVAPIFTTSYTLSEMGNILLFQSDDKELKERMKLAAEKLLSWQHDDGSFVVAYDRFSHELTFPDLKDYRPTWYGFLVAYKILKDAKYLEAAKNGAKWLINNGVSKGYFLGVCGDARNIWDFTTAQCSEAFLELYEITKDEIFKEAAIETAKIYTTSIFTQPMASKEQKFVNGVSREDWEINQVGLGVEHIQGSGNHGPILLSSYTGLFVRMYKLTNKSLFLTMARAAARGRGAYVEPASGKSLYYWNRLDNVGKYATQRVPWQAYWQIGWMLDYLMSEASFRSDDQIHFPSGFMTPKVGPHVTYGFAPGSIYGQSANLIFRPGMIQFDNSDLEYLSALSKEGDKLYVMIMNQSPKENKGIMSLDTTQVGKNKWGEVYALHGNKPAVNREKGTLRITIPEWGLVAIVIELS